MKERIIFKNGDSNVYRRNLELHWWRVFVSITDYLLEIKWAFMCAVLFVITLASWSFFAGLYYVVVYFHGDLDVDHLPKLQGKNNWTPCITAIDGFPAILMFSMETQQSIGYGFRAPTSNCPGVIFVVVLQILYNFFACSIMAEIIFKKIMRGRLKSEALRFSKSAVVCQSNEGLSLMFRVGDTRSSYVISSSVRALLMRIEKHPERNKLTHNYRELQIGYDDCGPDLFFVWPVLLEHKIDSTSPFFNMSATELNEAHFEIIVVLKGVVASTGLATRSRTSYLSSEIIWGRTFDPVVSYDTKRQCYMVDYANFDKTSPTGIPIYSARTQRDMKLPHFKR